MNVLITLTTAGADTGPFNLYSNVDNYTTAFETNISKGILVAGYTSTIVPSGTTAIRVRSIGICTNYVDIILTVPATTTTTTTRVSTTTTTTAAPVITTTTTTAVPVPTTTTTTTYVGPATTTTTSTTETPPATTTTTTTGGGGGTTTTTTTAAVVTTSTTTTSLSCFTYNAQNNNLEDATIFWTNCDGSPGSEVVAPSAFSANFCARAGSVSGFNFTINTIEPCGGPTTTTTTTATPLYEVWNLYRSEGAENPACSTTPASLTILYNPSYTPGLVFKASNDLCYTIANSGFQVSAPTITVGTEYGNCTECTETPVATTTTSTTSTTTTAAPILYTQYTLCTDFNVKYYIVGTGVGSSAIIAELCYQIAGTTFTPEGTEFFTSSGTCECP